MVKYILHGGLMSRETDSDRDFFREFTKDLKDGDKVLWVGFARRTPEDRVKTFERDKTWILAGTDKDIVVENAELDTLGDQVRQSQAVFVTGGHTQELLQDVQKSCTDFFEILDGKVYAGSSAGALILSTKYWGNSLANVYYGGGVFPMALMVHYGAEEFNATDEGLEMLEQEARDLEVVALPENEWFIREK